MSGVIENANRKKLKDHVRGLEDTIRGLEENLKQSNSADNQVMISLETDKIKQQGISNQLQEALKENQQLLNMLQQKTDEIDVSRTTSQADIAGSCSTMSIVRLQYKYEELLANHHGLLKLLDMKSAEIKKVYDENMSLKTEMEQLKRELFNSNQNYEKLQAKFFRLKDKKNAKIEKLKVHKETLQMVHNQLVNVLHNQCMEQDGLMLDQIKNCSDSDKALLLQEMRRNNMLAYENFHLNQKLEYLQSIQHGTKKLERN